jgi:hypothetical protein
VTHGIWDIMTWSTTVGDVRSGSLVWDRHSAVPHGVRGLTLWVAALCPSAVGQGGSRPGSAMGRDARVWLPI